jgi:hypothetical protein
MLFTRHFIAQSLLPLIQSAPGLKRIVDVAVGAKEIPINLNDLEAERCNQRQLEGRLATTKSLAWQELAERAPEVSIVTAFPGLVVTPIFGRIEGWMGVLFRAYAILFGWLVAVPLDECAERHVFMATSSHFPSKIEGESRGAPVVGGLEACRGVDGEIGSGVYSVDRRNDAAGAKVIDLLRAYSEDGTRERIWQWMQDTF